ncbi:MAG: type VI secretion system protein ImpH [Pirellulaceae bacterium]|jgi:type VI secretion system protein ImpH
MATANRRNGASLESTFRKHPYRFNFFQAIRLMERIALEKRDLDPSEPADAVGYDHSPAQEIVRFRAYPARSFPPCDIVSVEAVEHEDGRDSHLEMVVSFMGLYGPAGVLPPHYTQSVIRENRQKQFALRDFLDLFNHRAISLFYRAWEKYRLPIAFERSRAMGEKNDVVTQRLKGLLGFGGAQMQDRFEVDDETFICYGGHFAHYPRNAVALQSMLADYLGTDLDVLQFQGCWLKLEDDDVTAMPSMAKPMGSNCQLGLNAIIGDRVWSVQSKIRIRIGPVDYKQFCRLMPGSRKLKELGQLVRTYVGQAVDFDFQVLLDAESIPKLKLGGGGSPPLLGFNTWLIGDSASEDSEDAVFVSDGQPTR